MYVLQYILIALVTNYSAQKVTRFFWPLEYLIECTVASIQQIEYDGALQFLRWSTSILKVHGHVRFLQDTGL